MKTKENGVTLIALVITIILILILASLGTTIGTETINSTAFTQFKAELKIMQDKVNELNQENKIENGRDLTKDEQEKIFNNQETSDISDIIFNSVTTDEEKNNIKNGFKYLTKDNISEKFGLDSIKRDYIINVEYRYVIFPYGFEYEGKKYYMIDQIDGEIYNVRYHNKNDKYGGNGENGKNFNVNVTNEKNRSKIEITNINYNGYVDKWQVKYRLEGNSYWETSNDLTFYIKKEGTYTIKVVHGDEIDLGEQKIMVLYDGTISEKVRNDVIKIGDYVNYTPDAVSTTDEKYTNLISELGTYSGSTENNTSTLIQENLNWRVLDVVDGEVRLISEVPTTSVIKLYGYNGYNNAVYLIDKACSTLYSKSGYIDKVQNLKIEDLEKYMKKIPAKDELPYSPPSPSTYYPSILIQEKNQTVIPDDDTIQSETILDLSEQTEPINQTKAKKVNSWKIKKTNYWVLSSKVEDFKQTEYYNLFILNEEKNNYYTSYWMSSRCVNCDSDNAAFRVRCINSGDIKAEATYGSLNNSFTLTKSFRPIITLNSDVQIDATNTEKDGTTAANAYILK